MPVVDPIISVYKFAQFPRILRVPQSPQSANTSTPKTVGVLWPVQRQTSGGA